MEYKYRVLEPDELMHYGVKGMQWGVRNSVKGALGRLRAKKKKKGTSATTKNAYARMIKRKRERQANLDRWDANQKRINKNRKLAEPEKTDHGTRYWYTEGAFRILDKHADLANKNTKKYHRAIDEYDNYARKDEGLAKINEQRNKDLEKAKKRVTKAQNKKKRKEKAKNLINKFFG